MKKKAELNLIDKAIAFVNPQGAVDRLLARQKLKNFEYDAVKYSRERKGPSSLSGAEDYRSNYDRVELMKRARDLAENVGLVRSILLKFAGHVAGTISYQARTQNPQVNTDVEAYWNEWWDKCDISTRHTGSTLMQVAVMSMLRDGDFLFVLVRDSNGDLKIQGIEADRLGDPFKVYTSLELIGGIHIDRNTGAPTAYDIYNRSIGDFYSYQITIPSSQAFHLFDPLRIDQYRGVSAFHTAINDATDIHELTSFEKMAAKVASSQSGIVKRNNNNAADLSTLSTEEDISGNQIKLETIESGKISYLEPGEDIIFPNGPSRPSGAFIEFHKVLMRNICLGLGIPYSFAVDPSAMSGPTARLEMQQAGRTFKRYQNLLNDKVLRPIKNIVIADAVARGLIQTSEGGKTARGIFNFGANVSIDLGRESASAIAEFKSGLRTGSDIYAERGADWEASMRQRAIEAKAIQDLAKEYGVPAETISDVVPPAKPEPMMPAPAPQIEPPESDEGEEPEGGDEPEPVEPIEPSSENLEVKKKESELADNCGTGEGGFQPGNTCAGGGDEKEKSESDYASIKSQKQYPKAGEIVDGREVLKKIPNYSSIDSSITDPYEIDGIREVSMDDINISSESYSEEENQRIGNLAEAIKQNKQISPLILVIDAENGGDKYILEGGHRIQALKKIGAKSFPAKVVIDFGSFKRAVANNEKISADIATAYKFKLPDSYKKEGDFFVSSKKLEALQGLSRAEIKMLIAGMMGGIELGKYDGIDFTPPKGARDSAKRALDVREGKPASQRGMTPVGIARARDLMNGVKLSPDTVRRMKAFFDRHEVDKKGATWDEQGKGWQAWNGWGGDAGYAWARKVVRQMESRDKELSTNQKDVVEFLRGRDCGQDDGGTFGPGNDCATGYGRPKQEGGYTPMRPGGKWPPGYKVGEGRTEERKKSTEQGKPRQEKPKEEKPSPEANEPMKGENLKPREWAKQIKANKEDKKLFEDFTGSRFREINRNPEGEESQRLVSLVDKQAPQKQEQEMYRGLTLKSDAEAEAFIDKLRGGTKLDRTLTSFTPDANKAVFFAYSKVQEPTSVFMVLKNSQNLRSIKDVSVEGTSEKEFVLTRGKRLRLIGEPKYKKDVYAKGANEFIIEVEEY